MKKKKKKTAKEIEKLVKDKLRYKEKQTDQLKKKLKSNKMIWISTIRMKQNTKT